MKMAMFLVLGTVLMSGSGQATQVEVQTSWYLGPGELGPVLHWGERFYDSDSVAYSVPGQVSLVASGVNHNAWVKHVIEQNYSIEAHATILPADLDEDGYVDLVAIIGWGENQVVWYERTNSRYSKGYVKHVVGSFIAGQIATTWPGDLDGDGDMDIVACGDEGLAWFENDNLVFTKRAIDNTNRYLYGRPGDVDNDGDVDIVVHDKSTSTMTGDLWLFRNDGSMVFSRELIFDTSGWQIWRINLADFNGDGFLDIQTSLYPLYVFLNDGLGNFMLSYTYQLVDTDGSWPSDFDADGDVDIMVGAYNYLFWLENDGTGTNFVYHWIGSGPYGDGGMAADVNLDGLMDAIGSWEYVGWFEQLENGSFVEHRLPDGYFGDSHWVYGENLDGDPCTGDVDIDILAAKDGEFAWWENRIISFAAQAWLESSILDAVVRVCWQRFGWDDHVPSGNELRYRVRSGDTVEEVIAAPWSSPIAFSGDTLSKYGVSPGQYFQYRIEFERTTAVADRSPTVYEVWVEMDTLLIPSLVTGGGWIVGDPPGPGSKRTFGFNAHSQGEAVWGQLQFIDHTTKLKVHSDTVKTLVIYEGDTMADFSGDCRVREHGGQLVLYTFECRVMDRGEPGRGVDWFSLDVYDGNGNLYYGAGDYLGGGNIQVHTEAEDGFAGDFSDRKVEFGYEPNSPQETAKKPRVLSPTDETLTSSPNPFTSSTTISFRIPPGHGDTETRSPVPYGSGRRRGDAEQGRRGSRIQDPGSQITLSIYNVAGRLVRTLIAEPYNHPAIQPSNGVEWDGKDALGRKVPAGIYMCRLQSREFAASNRLVVLR